MVGLLLFVAVQAATVRTAADLSENPIRRIVTLLQNMEKEVGAEQAKDQEMHEKFGCYCTTNSKALDGSVAALNDQIPQIEAAIKETASAGDGVAAELVQHKQERADAKAAIAAAGAQREKEANEFAKVSADLKANIGACSKAVSAISSGMAGSFLQSNANALRQLIEGASLSRYDRSTMLAFISTKTEYAAGSGEIVGILKQLLEDMEGDLKASTETEDSAIADFEGLVSAKEKEIQASTEAIEAKTQRSGELAVKLVSLKNDLADAQDSLASDSQYLAELKKQCADNESEYAHRQQMRSQELVAISETVKILNDDDALDLFKQTLPSPSLFQTVNADKVMRADALAALQGSAQATQFVQLALMGKKVGFEKIVGMIDAMVTNLGNEQTDDDNQRAWCNKEFDVSEDKSKDLQRKTAGLDTQIDEASDAIATLKDEIAALVKGIAELDASVADATATRKEAHAAFVQTQAENQAAVQLLGIAKNRLNKFYNPKTYQAPPQRELTEEERLYVASGGTLDPTPAPGGIAGTGVTVFSQVGDAPAAAPEVMGAYTKRDSSGPVALIDTLKNDLEKDVQANEFDENASQKDYEEMMSSSAAKRATDTTTITEKQGQKAGLESDLEDAKQANHATKKELLAMGEYIASLHGSCDFLVANFGLRKEARAAEVDALSKAKAVLSGADYSFVQVSAFLARA